MIPQRFITVKHVCLPAHELARGQMLVGETISQFLKRTGWEFKSPTICVVNGEPVMRAAWNLRIATECDSIGFISRPWGSSSGDGGKLKSVLGLVGIIALAAVAPWAAGVLNGALGLGLGSVGLSLLSGAIVLGGSLLISTLITPKAGGQQDPQQTDSGAVDQVYSLTFASNTAKPNGVIPVGYGTVKSFPTYAAQPWAEYVGQDQYLNVLLCIGLGKYQVHTTYIDKTILFDENTGLNSAFSDVEWEQYDPGEDVTLFPLNVTSSTSVSGQELPDPNDPEPWIGGFVASDAGTTTTALAVDLAFGNGLYSINQESGAIESAAVTITAQYRTVDDAGAPTGVWGTLFSETFTGNSRTPIRFTRKVDVADGRYEVRVSRGNTPNATTNISDGVEWLGLRAFLKGPASFDDVTVLAIRIKASAQLSQYSSKQIGVLATRILPVWNGSTFVEQTTQNPLWAFYDAATNTTYGAGRPASKIDFQVVVDEAAAADSRGDTFNYVFTATTTIPSAFDTILKTTRCKHRWSGDVLSLFRDEWVDVPQMLLTDRQIVRGSLSFNYIFNDDDGADAVVVEYLDENTWQPAEVQYPPESIDFTATNPSRVRLDGITSRTQATNEAAFLYFQAYYRRIKVTLNTEHDGRLLNIGSVIRVQSELPQSWGSSGIITDRVNYTLTLSPTPTWQDGQNYIRIRTRTGSIFGPVKVSQGASEDQAILSSTDLEEVETQQDMTLDEALDRLDGAEEPVFELGNASKTSRVCLVLSGKPDHDNVTLELVVDSENVHTTDLDSVPALPSSSPLTNSNPPVIAFLQASFQQGVAEPILNASWWPAANAQYYVADVSYDSGTTWLRIYEGAAPSFSKVVNRASLIVRVAGVGNFHGSFVTQEVDAPTITIAPDTVAPSSLKAGLEDYIMTQLQDTQQVIDRFRQTMASLTAETDAHDFLKDYNLKTILANQIGAVSTSIQEVQQTIQDDVTGQITVLNGDITTLSNELEGTQGSVSDLQSVTAEISGKLTAAWIVKLDVNGYISGLESYNDGTTAATIFTTDIFKVAAPDTEGGDPVTMFEVANVGGTPRVVLAGAAIQDGAITASKMSVSELTAITANLGDATVSGAIRSRATGARWEISSTNNNIVFYDG